jgi:hypothetical protein
MKPHIVNPRLHSNTVPGPFHIVEMANPVLSYKHIGVPLHPGKIAKRRDQRVGHGQEMRAPGLGLWDPPLGPGQTHIVPPHGQQLCASRAGQERGQQDCADIGVHTDQLVGVRVLERWPNNWGQISYCSVTLII